MTVKEFLSVIDLESFNNQGIIMIIPIQKRLDNGNIKNIGDCELSNREKIIFDASEWSVEDYELYDAYGIEPCFKSENEEDEDYEVIDVRNSDDYYNYVYNENGEVWVIVG